MNYIQTHLEQIGQTIAEKAASFILTTILFFILYQIGIRIVRKLFHTYSERSWVDSARILTFGRLTASGISYTTAFLYLYTVLGIFGIPVGNLLAGAGILGVALGFAGRDLVADVINGFFIIVERQVNVGDIIRFENLEIEGTVKAVGIRSITLISDDGATVFVPNRNIEALKNFSYQNRSILVDVPVTTENLTEMKNHILAVDEKYKEVVFIGIVTVDDKIYLRSKVTAPSSDLTALKMKLYDEYYKKD